MLTRRHLTTAALVALASLTGPGAIAAQAVTIPAPPPDDTGCNATDPTVLNIPCSVPEVGDWDPGRDCYVGPSPGPHPPTDPVWEGNYPDGAIYRCTEITGMLPPANIRWGGYYDFWAGGGGGGVPAPPPPPDPQDIAEDIVDGMDLGPITIGIAPRPGADSMGLVGLPVWMWAENPSPTTWGPITDAASERGVEVTVTVEVTHARWDMGDGGGKSCSVPGTPWKDSPTIRSSPDCGFVYNETSAGYQVTATTHWEAEWTSNTGESGTVDVDPMSTSVTIRIGELQSIRQ